MNKPRLNARPLGELAGRLLAGSFAKQGFASAELVTRWAEVVGAEIAEHAQPIKMQWPRTAETEAREPGTLVLRVEGPAAIEIQHLAPIILERVNRYFGWQAVARLAIRQAPLARPKPKKPAAIDPAEAAKVAASLPQVEDEALKDALARLGAAVKRK